MATTKQIQILRRLAVKPLTTIDLTEDDLKTVQDLVRRGFARDYADFHGRRTEVRLRIWGINSHGRAVLEQQSLVDFSTRRQQLNLITNPAPPKKLAPRSTKPRRRPSN